MNNFYESVQLIWRLASLVYQSQESLHVDSDTRRAEQMLNFVCKEQDEVFSKTARLFPINFPAKQQNSLDLVDNDVIRLHFGEELEGLQRYLEDTQFKLDELHADDYLGAN